MSFNEWRHRHTSYDNRMRTALTVEQQQRIQREVAMQAMQLAVQQQDKTFARSVMTWAQSKRILEAA